MTALCSFKTHDIGYWFCIYQSRWSNIWTTYLFE